MRSCGNEVTGSVLSVQVGRPRSYTWLGRSVVSSIFKDPVSGPVQLRHSNLTGDEQADQDNHGGLDKAVYAYAREDEDWWQTELGRDVPNGTFGENLTTTGLDLTNAVIGQIWSVGTAVLQVTQPRTPCWKLGLRMGDKSFPRRAAASRRPGVLLRVLTEGVLEQGEPVVPLSTPSHGVTAAAINRIYYGEDKDLRPLFETPELAAHWRGWAEHRTIWHEADDDPANGATATGPTSGS